mgnify:FL=1
MSYFDELVARYKNMQYGGLSARNPSAIDNVLRTQQGLLGNSLQFRNDNQTFMENIPTDEQQFIDTPTGRVAQNRFRMGPDGNPIFGVPGQLDADGSVGGAASYDSSIDYGDPGYAGVLPVDPVTGLVSTQTTQRQGGRGGDRDGPGVSTEFIGGRAYRINADGSVTPLDPESLDFKFNNVMNNILGFSPMQQAKGLLGLDDSDDPNEVYNRIEDKYGEETALEFSLANAKDINKEMTTNPDARRAAIEKEFMTRATQEQKDRLAMSDAQRDITTARSDPSNSRQGTAEGRAESRAGTNKARDDASKSTGVGRGFMGGR